MIPLPKLTWTVWIVTLWTSGASPGSVEDFGKGAAQTLYPKINALATVECTCHETSCESVSWFRTLPKSYMVQYLGYINKADRHAWGTDVDKERFKFSKKGSTFVLRFNATEDDAGVYSCVLKGVKDKEFWQICALLRPGVTPPTLAPPKKPTTPPKPCKCKKAPQVVCSSMVLWPLVGITAGLALVLVCTLYYFSRLPKKCRHHFVKKR